MKNIIFFVFYFSVSSVLAQTNVSKNSVNENKKDSITILDAVNAEPLNPFIKEPYKSTIIKSESNNAKVNVEKIIICETLPAKRLEKTNKITNKLSERTIQDTSLKVIINEAIPMQPK